MVCPLYDLEHSRPIGFFQLARVVREFGDDPARLVPQREQLAADGAELARVAGGVAELTGGRGDLRLGLLLRGAGRKGRERARQNQGVVRNVERHRGDQ